VVVPYLALLGDQPLTAIDAHAVAREPRCNVRDMDNDIASVFREDELSHARPPSSKMMNHACVETVAAITIGAEKQGQSNALFEPLIASTVGLGLPKAFTLHVMLKRRLGFNDGFCQFGRDRRRKAIQEASVGLHDRRT
jgi:hypothetical protein